ncbi:DUF2970 domain-containing protein [Gilvimarinus sp. DA14]|uniref:DUF2970 domain-containing protein n=1 Tax=Gilvimarinus sp. DA14 TaxID=2956798 RepID=UPI0020B8085D|nr:DUF2970 domain-containing protein [Gilvimarinus sp. DA14]UTF60735.1 DUF2970 domain-containing protein [Gilvimarinus sp. DA14]
MIEKQKPQQPETAVDDRSQQKANKRAPSLWQIVVSTLAAAVGVQSNKNRERDFTQGNLIAYVVAGIVFTGLFIGGLIFLVNRLLAGSLA